VIDSHRGFIHNSSPPALELPSIGWQLFILDSSQSNSTAFPLCLDTYATRLLTEPLKQIAVRPLLYTYTRRVVGDAMNIVLTFKRAIDEDIDSEVANTDYEGFWPSLEETQRMCAAINRASQAPQFAGTWVEFLAFQKRRTEDECSRIYTATPFLEAEHPQLLIDLENCSYFNFVPWVVTFGAGDGDLSFMAKQLHEYFERARRLHEYANRHLTLSGQWEPFPPR
jgi:hypothetical protein